MPQPGEFDLIARIRARAGAREDVALGIGDDAALLRPTPGELLVATQDTLNDGVHFPTATAATDVGHKALAVNLSDLAAMGARPAWCTLSLSLPAADTRWLDGFLDGFLALAARHRIGLVGGDMTRGPLSISVAALGQVAPDQVLRRDRARCGDDLWVTGTLGDAAAALHLMQHDADAVPAALRERLDRPTPRVEAGLALAGLAHACIDVSDGLLADLGHVLAASGVGARVDADRLPTSAALAGVLDVPRRQALQLGGGDDYELCFSAAPARRAAIAGALAALGVAATRIGTVVGGSGISVSGTAEGMAAAPVGHDHFRVDQP